MQIAAVSTTTTSSTTSSSSSSTSALSDNYEMFLTLMLKQLEVQDPTDPEDASEYTSQLAQFSMLEQQISNGEKLDTISSQLADLNFATTSVSYLGREVTVDGDTAPLQNGSASWEYDLDEAAESVTLTVTDADGNTVYKTTAGGTDEGTNSFTWDGTGTNGTTYTAGNYTLSVSAKDADGNTITGDLRAKGTVTSVDSSDGDTVLELGGVEVSLDDVVGVG